MSKVKELLCAARGGRLCLRLRRAERLSRVLCRVHGPAASQPPTDTR